MEVKVNDDNFETEVIEKSKKVAVLVDFWAPWCGPCLMLGPVIKEALDTNEFRKKVILAKANTSDCRLNSIQYKVDAIPNIKLFKDGKVVDSLIGFRPLESIKEWLRKNLNGGGDES